MKGIEQIIIQLNRKLTTNSVIEEIKPLLEKLILSNISINVINVELSNDEQLEIYKS